MGAVYLAKDLRFDDSFVALKKITIEFDKLDEKQQKLFKSAFEREANLLAKLSHESIPRVTDYFSESDSQYLVMELVDGDDLGALLGKGSKYFPVEQVLEWSYQILDALDYLHNQNPPIIHRDLKPANLKLTSRGKIKLLDFGIAKGTDGKNANSTTVTNHTFVGATLNYSPIEQLFRVIDPNYRDFIIEKFAEKAILVMNQNADTRSDTFALGATFYHLTTGVLPNDALKRALDIWSGKPDPLLNPTEVNPDIPPELGAVLLKSLSTDVESRYHSAKEMSDALRQAMADEKARKEALGKGNQTTTPALINYPIPFNSDQTQAFLPEQMDLGDKTRVEPTISLSNLDATQIESLHSLPPQETQINSVTSTQEPKLDRLTFTDRPLNNDATKLPGDVSTSDIKTEVLPKDLIQQAVAEADVRKESQPEENGKISLPSSHSKADGYTPAIPKKGIIALASTAGIGLALIASCVVGYLVFGGSDATIKNTANETQISNKSNRQINEAYDYGSNTNVPAQIPTVETTNSPVNNLNVGNTKEEPKDTLKTPKTNTPTPKPNASTPKPDVPTPRPSTPTPKPNTPPPCVKDKSPDCLFNGKCKTNC